jgi:hypothetical protein
MRAALSEDAGRMLPAGRQLPIPELACSKYSYVFHNWACACAQQSHLSHISTSNRPMSNGG